MGMIITTLLCFVIAVTLVIIFIIVVVMFVITVVITFMVKNNIYSQALCVGCVLMLGGLSLRREENIREVFLLTIPAAVLCCYPGVRSLR